MIGFFSFGGGYAMLPLIELKVIDYGWLTTEEFQKSIALAGMAPGSIATNVAIIVGFQTAGLSGAIVSALGMVLPSLMIILIVARTFFRIKDSKFVFQSLYALRPIITGLIVYAAISLLFKNDIIQTWSWSIIGFVFIFILSLFLLLTQRLAPILIIVLSAVLGVIFF